MAQLVINIPNDKVNRLMNALTGAWGYEPFFPSGIEMIPNPETKAAFVKRRIIEDLKNTVYQYEREKVVNIAVKNAIADAETTIIKDIDLD